MKHMTTLWRRIRIAWRRFNKEFKAWDQDEHRIQDPGAADAPNYTGQPEQKPRKKKTFLLMDAPWASGQITLSSKKNKKP